MSNDLLITPGSRKQEFKDSSGNVDAKIETDSNGNLKITNTGGDIEIGDTSSDVFIGDGTNNIDIVFEQDGEIRGTSGVTLTLGATGSNVRMASDLNLNGNDITSAGDLTITGDLNITGNINSTAVTDLDVTDKTITVGVGQNEASSGGSGLIVDGSAASMLWDEGDNRFEFNKNIYAPILYGSGAGITVLNASNLSSGTIPSARINGEYSVLSSRTLGQLKVKDDRIIEPNSINSGTMQFGFSSFANNNSAPYSDFLHLRSYTDSSGGNDNLLMFSRGSRAMRLFNQSWNSGTAYSTYSNVMLDRNNLGTITGGTSQSFDDYYNTGIAYVSNWPNGTGTTNGPSHEGDAYGWGMLRVTEFIDQNYVVQEYIPHNDDGTFIRVRWNSSWGAWRQSWTSRNDGASSGLNADKLDNQEGSYYLDYNNFTNIPTGAPFLPLSGGTMTGAIVAAEGISGLDISNGISGNNYNISGVNSLTINDPGEGIIFAGTNNVSLYAVDDASDNIMKFDGAAKLLVANDRVLVSSERDLATNSTGTTSTDFVTVYNVNGNNLASHVRLSVTGTTGNVVVSCVADILVNHSQDIFISSMSGNYTQLDIKVTSNNNEDFAIECKRTDSQTTQATLRYSLIALSQDTTISQPSSHSYTGATLTHTTKPGSYQSATSDAAHGYFPSLRVESKVMHEGDTDTNITFDNDRVRIFAGNTVKFDSNNTYITASDSSITNKLPLAGGTMTGTITGRDFKTQAGYHFQRSDHHSGHLEGSYNNVGANGSKSNPIYTIGSSYNPSDAAFGNMYGIGYCSTAHTGISFTGMSNWGMYVAADGDARVWLDGSAGVVSSTGEHYVGSSRVFHDTYHPNADAWTTARTLTLSGEASGSVSWSGSANATLSVTLSDSALDNQYVQILPRHNADGDSLVVTSRASITIWDVSGASDAPSSASDGLVLSAGWDSASWGIQQYHDFHSNDLYLRAKNNGSMTSWERVFHDTYHPNADKWTTARTLTLSGDVTGSVSFDGSAAINMTNTVVANDSHTHSIYVPKAGGEMNGSLTIDVDNQAGGALRIEANQTNPEQDFYFAEEIYSTLSGSTVTTSDREQGAIYIDLNSSATGGDTSNEHRVYGIYADVDSTGDADVVTAGYFNATATPTTGTTTQVAGIEGFAEDNGGAGSTTTIIGVKGTAWSDNATSDVNTLSGGQFKAGNAADSGAIAAARGVQGEIELTTGSGDIYGTSYVFDAQYDNNTGAAPTHTAALYYGNYAGELPTTALGVYIVDAVPNSFAGSIRTGLGTTSLSAYGFIGDTNTGMYSPANHQLGFTVNGSRKLLLQETTASFQNLSGGLEISTNLDVLGKTTLTNSESDQNTAADTTTIPATGNGTGGLVQLEGGYTNGTYTTQLAKIDRSGNLPLYVRGTLGTANSYSNIARFGTHGQAEGSFVFAVFGNTQIKDGNFDVYGNINLHTESDTGTNSIHLPRGGMLSFYGNANDDHAITSKNQAQTATDDLRFSSYGSLYFNLDSNSNNTSTADFVVARHSHASNKLFQIDGETGAGTGIHSYPNEGGDGVSLMSYAQGTTPINQGVVQIRSVGKTGWANGDEMGSIDWYNSDGSGVGARNLARIVAVNSQGNGSSTTTFNGELHFYTSTYNAQLNAAPVMRLTENNSVVIGDGTDASSCLQLRPADDGYADDIQFYNGSTRMGEIGTQDTSWLRINQSTAKNIYTPRYIRADSGFYVDNTTLGINGSGRLLDGSLTGTYTNALTFSNTITIGKLHAGAQASSYPDGNDPDISTDDIFATTKVVSPRIVWLNDASGDDNYAICDDGNTAYTVDGVTAGAWWKWYGDKTLASAGHYFNLWKGTHGEITGNFALTGSSSRLKFTSNDGAAGIYFGSGQNYTLNTYHESKFRLGSVTTGSPDDRRGIKWTHSMGPDMRIWGHGDAVGSAHIKIHVLSSGDGTDEFMFTYDGNFHADGNIYAYSNSTSSDARLKENVRDLKGSLDKTLNLRGVMFDWIEDERPDDQIGLIAQEVENILPEVVEEVEFVGNHDGEKYKVVNYQAIVPVLVEAIKEQQSLINRLEERLKILENNGE